MIFEVKDKEGLIKISTSELIEQIGLKEFLKEANRFKKIPTCPVNAIDLDNGLITSDCNDCGLCWISDKKSITKKDLKPDYNKFRNYLDKDKMFIYRWLSLSLTNYSGVEITVTGYSRNKRVPLIVKNDDSLFFIKAIRDIADIEKAKLEIQDIIELSKDMISDYKKKIIAIIINEYDALPNTEGIIPIKLKKIYDEIIVKGKIDIKELIL